MSVLKSYLLPDVGRPLLGEVVPVLEVPSTQLSGARTIIRDDRSVDAVVRHECVEELDDEPSRYVLAPAYASG